MRFTLQELYGQTLGTPGRIALTNALKPQFTNLLDRRFHDFCIGMTDEQIENMLGVVCTYVYEYFYRDLVAYESDSGNENEVRSIFEHRFAYDIAVKMSYWYLKYQKIADMVAGDLSLMQTSKVTSSSTDATHSAGGTLQKGATTPTGVSSETSPDEINITMGESEGERTNEVETNGFVDKYTNHQQKFVNASEIKGERAGEILREGSIDELLKVLEKLPSSFADEINRDLQKHFIFDYEGEERGIYA